MRKKENPLFIEIKDEVQIGNYILEKGDKIRVLTENSEEGTLGIIVDVSDKWIGDSDWEDASIERYNDIIFSIEDKFNVRFSDMPGDLDDDTLVSSIDDVSYEKAQEIINFYKHEFKKLDYYLFFVPDTTGDWGKERDKFFDMAKQYKERM